MSNSNHYGMWARTLDSVWHDVRLALRVVRRSPGFSATIALTLALGIGANAAIFGVFNSLLLRPLPVADPHRLVTIASDAAIARETGWGPLELCDVGRPPTARVALRRRVRVDARTIRPGGARRAAARGRDLRQRRVLRDARRRGNSGPHVHVSRRSVRRRAGRRGRRHQLRTLATALRGGRKRHRCTARRRRREGHDRWRDGTGVPGPRRREPVRYGVAARNGAAHPSRPLGATNVTAAGHAAPEGRPVGRGGHGNAPRPAAAARLHAGAEYGPVHARAGRYRRVTPRSRTIRAATVLHPSPPHDSDGGTARAC